MKVITEYPFNEYNGYTMVNTENRMMISLVHKITKIRTTTSYARYLMSIKLKRILLKEEHIDHIDENKTNDAIENLTILSPLENSRKYHSIKNVGRKHVKLVCPNCKCIFLREYRNSFLCNGGFFSCCSKKCLYEFLKTSRSKDEMKRIGENQVIEVFQLHQNQTI